MKLEIFHNNKNNNNNKKNLQDIIWSLNFLKIEKSTGIQHLKNISDKTCLE